MDNIRHTLKDKKRIVVKIGSSSLTHEATGNLNLAKMEKLVRILTDIRNQGIEVVLVSSGAIPVGRKTMGIKERPKETSLKQACAAIGQARLMTIYQKLFDEYHQVPAQVLMTKLTMVNEISRYNAKNTFDELLKLGVIPIVNENDTVATDELAYGDFGDNDTLSAIVTALIQADLLILLSDIDGLFTDNPRSNPDAKFIETVAVLDDELMQMGKATTGSNVGTGGMNTKLIAAKIATSAGADMVIANSEDIHIIHRIIDGRNLGTIFCANKDENFDLPAFVADYHK